MSTSQLFPPVSTWLTDTPRSIAWPSEKPNAPDWLTMPTACDPNARRPGTPENVSPAPLTKFITPIVFGPTSRIPDARATSTIRACSATRSARPVSANPDAARIIPPTPSAAACATNGATASRPTATNTQSGTTGNASSPAKHGFPATV